ncbi:zinc-binding dehydrogenase [Rhizobium sp. Leaf386]|uniref:alcohol dehydrogenase catalytic domain-containing protein n=1 Tax=Rhizobium sp. Leaf386 TaxID=1736359 RepID=UPI0009EB49CF|nr:zinc-binding dehydrogenase [Rhizobium sp. Leaf386]
MTKFKAAVLHAPNAPVEIEQVELCGLGPDDVLVKVHAAGVCHTDWEVQQGAHGAPKPLVLGHEGAGTVAETGSRVTDRRVGDRVVFTPFANCGSCFYCRRSLPILCEPVVTGHRSARLPDGSSRLRLGSQVLGHFLSISSFAEYAVVPRNGAVRIPQDMPLDLACLLGCAVITGVGAVTRIADVRVDETVCVVGCGPVGLNVIQGAKLVGARNIIAVDPDAGRRNIARILGATQVIDPLEGNVVSLVREVTEGRGADHSFETAGRESALQTALDASRPGGSVTILGKMEPDAKVGLRFGSLTGERNIRRSALGGGRGQDDIPMFARAYLDGRLRLEELVTARLTLADVNIGLQGAGSGTAIRTILMM